MERSEPDDGAWDDPLGMGMPSEPEYPPAPIPFHERRWRHPSEIGQAAWVQSERSVSLGRGLLITSGAIGCILGLAVVWLMVPGPGGGPTAAPTVSRSDLALPTTLSANLVLATTVPVAATLTAVEPSIEVTLPSVPDTAPPAAASTTATATPDTVLPSAPTIQLPAEDLPTNTVWLKSEAEGSVRAVAVLVGNAPYLITTAAAVGSVETVQVMLASGGRTETEVVAVDEAFAYLQPDASLLTFGFAEAAVAVEGESLTVLSDQQIVFTFGDETLAAVDPATVAEGTPVVNENGALVGLCTGASGTLDIVQLPDATPEAPPEQEPETTVTEPTDSVDTTEPATSTTTTPATTTTSTTPASTTTSTTPTTSTTVPASTTIAAAKKVAWMGVKLAGAESPTPLVITAITAGSPAEVAGLVVGERVVAIDAVAVTTVDELIANIRAHVPGDTVVLTLSTVGTDGKTTERQVSVVLGENTL